MWDLEDRRFWSRFCGFSIPGVRTWGGEDGERREFVREKAAGDFPPGQVGEGPWAFRIRACYGKGRPFDVDNVAKLIVDSFGRKQIGLDGSRFPEVGLYDDDTMEHVAAVFVAAEATEGNPRTEVEIFRGVKVGAHPPVS